MRLCALINQKQVRAHILHKRKSVAIQILLLWPLCALMVWPTACLIFSTCAAVLSLQRALSALASDVLTAGEIAYHVHSTRHGAFLCHRSGMTCESARARRACGRCALARTAEQPPHLRSSTLPASCRTTPLQVLLLQGISDEFTTAVVAFAQNLFHACSLNTFLGLHSSRVQEKCVGYEVTLKFKGLCETQWPPQIMWNKTQCQLHKVQCMQNVTIYVLARRCSFPEHVICMILPTLLCGLLCIRSGSSLAWRVCIHPAEL